MQQALSHFKKNKSASVARVAALAFTLVLTQLFGCKTRTNSAAIKEDQNPASEPTFAERMGLSLEADAKGSGVRVAGVMPVSPGCVMGIRAGDTIVAVNGLPVKDAQGFLDVATKNLRTSFQPWCFLVLRGQSGEQAFLPRNCNTPEVVDADPRLRQFQCDPSNLVLCGPFTAACADPSVSGSSHR